MLVRHAMTKNVFRISLPASLAEVTSIMLKKRISSLPIIEEDKPVGIITTTDILGLFSDLDKTKFLDPETDIKKIMSSPVTTINQNDQLRVAIDLMSDNAFHHLIVVDDLGELIGILSSLDIARAYGKDETKNEMMDN
ncbi:MAG: Inosine-5'-monophosphate dehydrogenase [Candidatus Heimdallarchaeota archaeon LC_3]|nr:MAG: Inosine-5'-monophosphate dehydrogenase [Candidatus Heimdallarchaeota archaeon LC_3]